MNSADEAAREAMVNALMMAEASDADVGWSTGMHRALLLGIWVRNTLCLDLHIEATRTEESIWSLGFVAYLWHWRCVLRV